MDELNTQQLQLLARKALLQDEIKDIEFRIGQLAAIRQFAAGQPREDQWGAEGDLREGPEDEL